MFWRKKKEPTLAEQTTEAIDKLTGTVTDLQEERKAALSTLAAVSDWLLDVNEELAENHKLAEALIGQLKRSQRLMEEEANANRETHAAVEQLLGIRSVE